MKQKVINEVMQEMLSSLNNAQLERLQKVLEHALFHKEITELSRNWKMVQRITTSRVIFILKRNNGPVNSDQY